MLTLNATQLTLSGLPFTKACTLKCKNSPRLQAFRLELIAVMCLVGDGVCTIIELGVCLHWEPYCTRARLVCPQ